MGPVRSGGMVVYSKRRFLRQSLATAAAMATNGWTIRALADSGTRQTGWTASPSVIARFEERASRRDFKVVYREEEVPPYSLPDPLVTNDGLRVADAATWHARRRPEILELFRKYVFGRPPIGRPAGMSFTANSQAALGGQATRKDLVINFSGEPDGVRADMRLYVPNGEAGPVPCFLYLGRALPADSSLSPRLSGALPEVLSRGYAVAIIDRAGMDPDEHDGFVNGVHGGFDSPGKRPVDAWGTIAAWAWGLSRALDYLETDDDVDARRVAVMGVSRAGKTALWAGAQDERFAMAISVCSGCTGAALSRRRFGEPVGAINARFPHWFCDNYKNFNWREDELPVDQHMLLALLAPRLLYVSSADEDLWADPRGEFLGAKHADPVYRLLGEKGLDAEYMPGLEIPVHTGRIGYHIRRGGHGLEQYDWLRYLDFADKHL